MMSLTNQSDDQIRLQNSFKTVKRNREKKIYNVLSLFCATTYDHVITLCLNAFE